MVESCLERELRNDLRAEIASGSIKVIDDSTPFFVRMNQLYPVAGWRIDWARVPNSIERVEGDMALQAMQFEKFFDEVTRKHHLSGDVVYLNDSAVDFALSGSLECIRAAFPHLLSLPQHNFFIGAEAAWCACCMHEGDMAFGFAPASVVSEPRVRRRR